jgi:hypothetical protein
MPPHHIHSMTKEDVSERIDRLAADIVERLCDDSSIGSAGYLAAELVAYDHGMSTKQLFELVQADENQDLSQALLWRQSMVAMHVLAKAQASLYYPQGGLPSRQPDPELARLIAEENKNNEH